MFFPRNTWLPTAHRLVAEMTAEWVFPFHLARALTERYPQIHENPKEGTWISGVGGKEGWQLGFLTGWHLTWTFKAEVAGVGRVPSWGKWQIKETWKLWDAVCFTGQGKKGHVVSWDGSRESIFNIRGGLFFWVLKFPQRVCITLWSEKVTLSWRKWNLWVWE